MAGEIYDNTLFPKKQLNVSTSANGAITPASEAGGASFGELGGKAITGTSAVTPTSGRYFAAINVMADAVVSAQGDITDVDNPDLTALTTIPAGTVLYGMWNSITLTSGQAIAYYKAVI